MLPIGRVMTKNTRSMPPNLNASAGSQRENLTAIFRKPYYGTKKTQSGLKKHQKTKSYSTSILKPHLYKKNKEWDISAEAHENKIKKQKKKISISFYKFQ